MRGKRSTSGHDRRSTLIPPLWESSLSFASGRRPGSAMSTVLQNAWLLFEARVASGQIDLAGVDFGRFVSPRMDGETLGSTQPGIESIASPIVFFANRSPPLADDAIARANQRVEFCFDFKWRED